MFNQSRTLRKKQISRYSSYCELVDKKKARKEIMKKLNIPYWKVREYEDYFNGNTEQLTLKKYSILRRIYNNEQIRKRYKIPICEFQLFLNGIRTLRKIKY